jgi:hypothetical protein
MAGVQSDAAIDISLTSFVHILIQAAAKDRFDKWCIAAWMQCIDSHRLHHHLRMLGWPDMEIYT